MAALQVHLPATLLLLLSDLVVSISSHGSESTAYTTDVNLDKTAWDKYINRCLTGMLHKDQPGAEINLHGQCQPWAGRACCDASTTVLFHNSPTWYRFDWNHCEELSQQCQRWMVQDLCFYECSPNVGPWLVEQIITIRQERFLGVPLCKSECDLWFNACRDDFTCRDDWSKGWNWTTDTNTCPEGSACRTFEEIFETAENFCVNLWGGSFEVVDDREPCMYFWFNDENPNDQVAYLKAVELAKSGSGTLRWTGLVLSAIVVATSLLGGR